MNLDEFSKHLLALELRLTGDDASDLKELMKLHNAAISLAIAEVERAREEGESDMRQVRYWIGAHKVEDAP